jgi:hypothetical protein
MDFITGKVAGPIFAVLSVILLIAVIAVAVVDGWKISTLETNSAALTSSINDPKTGYVVRNAQCQTNVATLSIAVSTQSATILALGQATAAAQARTAAAMAKAQVGLDAAQVAAAKILALKPTGDLCAAALDLARQP